MRKLFVLAIISAAVVFNGTAIAVVAPGWSVTQLTDSYENCYIRTSGNYLYWTQLDIDSQKLACFDGNEITYLNNFDTLDYYVSGRYVCWKEQSGSITTLKFYDGNVVTILSSGTNQIDIAGISGKYVLWLETVDYQNSTLKLWDGNSTTTLSSNTYITDYKISGTNAAWIERTNGGGPNYALKFWDGSSTETVAAATGLYEFEMAYEFEMQDNALAWVEWDYSEEPVYIETYTLKFWDGDQIIILGQDDWGEFFDITILGNKMLWWGQYKLMCWNGTDTQQLDTYDDSGIQILRYGQAYAIWTKFLGTDKHLFIWTGDDPIDAGTVFDSSLQLSISGQNIAWTGDYGDRTTIMLWDGTKSAALTDFDNSRYPSTDGNDVVWSRSYNLHGYIYFWNGIKTQVYKTDYELPENDAAYYQAKPIIANDKIFWTETDDYGVYQVMMAEPDGAPVPANCEEAKAMGYTLAGDLNGDCKVNFKDVAMVMADWLKNYDPADEGPKPWE
jgi:hypothetical protein